MFTKFSHPNGLISLGKCAKCIKRRATELKDNGLKSSVNMNCILRHLSCLTFKLFVLRLLKNPGLASYGRFSVLFIHVSNSLCCHSSAKLTNVKEQLCSIEKIKILTYGCPLMSEYTTRIALNAEYNSA